MRYSTQNGILIAEVPVCDFKITLVNHPKKSLGKTNYCNANFFGTHPQYGYTFPSGHLVSDYAVNPSASTADKWCDAKCHQYGTFNGNKFIFDNSKFQDGDQFKGKFLTTLQVKSGKAFVSDVLSLPNGLDYAVTGIPIMLNGEDVSWKNYVSKQGWYGNELYATWHIFAGVKAEKADTIYVLGMKTTSGNMISSAEAFQKLRVLGLRDVIKLDGGGSFYFNAAGKTQATAENRRVNAIIEFGATETSTAPTSVKTSGTVASKNPYQQPTVALKKGSTNKEGVKWLQWELNRHGASLTIDGSFGPATDAAVRDFQKKSGLVVDGSVGPATRAALVK